MSEDVWTVVERRSERFCPDRGRLRDFVAEIIEFARSVPRDAELEYNDDFTLSVTFKRPETEAERYFRQSRERWEASVQVEKELAVLDALMLKYKDIAKIKMRDIEECVNVK